MAKIVYPDATPGKIGEGLLPRKRDIVIYQGDDFSVNVSFGSSPSSRVNMLGWTARCSFKRTYDAPPVDAVLAIANDGMSLTMSLPGEITSQMSGSYVYDLELTNLEGKRKTYMYGEAQVIPEVTKAV